jgi:glycosyltransferase involved in cell wall biosynthesis
MKFSGSSLITLMRNSWFGRLELRWLQKWARRVMILNPGMAEEAAAAGFEPHQLLWMPNPVDTEEFAPCGPDQREGPRARLGIPAQAALVVFVGRLAPEKELSSLMGAWAAVVRRMPRAMLALVGDGPSRKGLEEQASRLGVSASVRFTGRRTAGEVRQWLQASDVFASTRAFTGCAPSSATKGRSRRP